MIINSCSLRLKNTMTEESGPDDVGKQIHVAKNHYAFQDFLVITVVQESHFRDLAMIARTFLKTFRFHIL